MKKAQSGPFTTQLSPPRGNTLVDGGVLKDDGFTAEEAAAGRDDGLKSGRLNVLSSDDGRSPQSARNKSIGQIGQAKLSLHAHDSLANRAMQEHKRNQSASVAPSRFKKGSQYRGLPDSYFSSCYIQNIKKNGAKRTGNSSTDQTPSRAAGGAAVRDKKFEMIVNSNLSFNFNDTKSKFFTNSQSAAPRRPQARKLQQPRDTSPTENDIFMAATATPREAVPVVVREKKPLRRLLAAQPKSNPYQNAYSGF